MNELHDQLSSGQLRIKCLLDALYSIQCIQCILYMYTCIQTIGIGVALKPHIATKA